MWDYTNELRESNLGLTMILGVEEHKMFLKFFICFKAMKERWMDGCQLVIGVDGCHLKGSYGGVLLHKWE